MTDKTMRNLNAAFRFVLELLVLLALLLFGLGASDDLIVALPVAVVLVGIVVTIWGLFVAPKATHRLDDPARLAVELAVWFVGALAFGFAVSWVVAILFGLAVITSLVLMFLLGQRGI
ncbi:MAG: YrdB family protein [Candidatus Limnocylindrales bacterium]